MSETSTETRTVWQLARLADCFDPDAEDSPGGRFLRSVEADVLERSAYGWDEEAVHEIADSAPAVYNSTRWAEFVDLGAWQEDVSEVAGGGEDMTTRAGLALYMIAERLVLALREEIEGESDDEDESDDA